MYMVLFARTYAKEAVVGTGLWGFCKKGEVREWESNMCKTPAFEGLCLPILCALRVTSLSLGVCGEVWVGLRREMRG